MRAFLKLLFVAALLAAAWSHRSWAQVTQTVTFEVDAINQIALTGAPSLLINAATPGSPPTSVQSTGVTWAVTTNQTGSTISASIASAMPAGLTLSVDLAAPAGATANGLKPVSTIPVALVTGVTKVAAGGLTVTYQLDATAAAGVVSSSTKVVTFTITGGV